MSDDDVWRTSSFRQNVVNKIDDAIAQSGMPTSKNSLEMENHVFLKAKSKDEYLNFVARLLLHVGGRDMRGGNQMMNMNQNPGPVNATTLLQTLSNRPQTQNKLPGQMAMGPGPMNQGPPIRPGGPMGQGPMIQNPNSGPMGNQMGQGPPMPMSSVMAGQPMQGMPVQMPGQGMPGVVPGNMPPNAMGRMPQRKMPGGPENVMMIPNQPVVGGYPAGPPRSVGTNQFLSHNSPSSPQQSPVNVLPSGSKLGFKRVSNDLEEVDSVLNNTTFTNKDDATILVNDTTPSSSNSENIEKSKSRKRCCIPKKCESGVDRECNYERTQQIHQALASLIAMNQLPISFCSSPGFCQFMYVIEPNYKICSDEAMKKRLHSLKSKVEDKIKSELRNVKSLVCTTDCWSSMAQNSYISLTAHIINNQWLSKSFTLAIQEIEEQHKAVNLAEKLTCILDGWEINGKVSTVITDNAKTVVNAVKLLPLIIDNENMDVTCAALNLQLAISTALKDETFSELIKQCSALVGHFKHSNVAKQSLFKKQEHLKIPHQSLVQYCKTRWNSIYLMLDRLLQNRTLILNVLTDRTVTSLYIAQKLEITESQWLKIEILVCLLKPLYIVTNLFCSENHSPASMVRPLLAQLMKNHLKQKENDDQNVMYFKRTIIHEIKERFKLDWNETSSVSVKQIASFLDPRYKDLEFEPISAREKIRMVVKDLLERFRTQNINLEQEPPVQRTDLEFLYGNIITDNNDISIQFQNYIAEPQLRFDLNSFEWWKFRENKYPALAELAKQYLAIPATSVSSERCFSNTGNIVTSKRTCLLTKNVNMLIFLYQNRELLL